MVKQRTPNSQDERSSRSAYAIISSVSSAGRTARLGREGRVFKSPTGELWRIFGDVTDVVNVADWKSEYVSSILTVSTFTGISYNG